MFLSNKTTLAGKTESTPYTEETLVDADSNVRIREDISYSLEMDEYRRRILDGTLDLQLSVIGKQRGTVSFTVDMAPSAVGSPATPPAWGKFLKACGFKETIFGAVGVSYVPHVDVTHTPITFEIQEQLEGGSADMLVTTFHGAMGNVTFAIGTVGEPIQMSFEFSGPWAMGDTAFAARIDPTGLTTIKPPAVLSATVTVGGVTQDIDSFEVNPGNEVQEWTDPSKSEGIKGFYISGKEPILTMDPTLKQISTEDVYGDWLNCVPGAVVVGLVAGAGAALTLSAPAAQLTGVGIGDRNGARLAEKTFLLTQGPAGNDVFEILQGAKV